MQDLDSMHSPRFCQDCSDVVVDRLNYSAPDDESIGIEYCQKYVKTVSPIHISMHTKSVADTGASTQKFADTIGTGTAILQPCRPTYSRYVARGNKLYCCPSYVLLVNFLANSPSNVRDGSAATRQNRGLALRSRMKNSLRHFARHSPNFYRWG